MELKSVQTEGHVLERLAHGTTHSVCRAVEGGTSASIMEIVMTVQWTALSLAMMLIVSGTFSVHRVTLLHVIML